MDLIYHRGLNCHLSCVINIAASLGVNYRDAFGTLWSETDFADEPEYHIFTSKRIFPNLEVLGVKTEVLRCTSNKDAEESFSLIPEGEPFLVGMDTFHIPWSPAYQNFHGSHYFFAKKEKPDSISCFDPTYSVKNSQLASDDIVSHSFDISRIRRLAANPPHFSLSGEAREVLRKHPETQEKLRAEIFNCKNREQKEIAPLIKQINAMINNRHLFQCFLQQFTFSRGQVFFDQDFFSRWEAVKNGLYKASIVKNNEKVLDEVCVLFCDLFRREIEMAEEMAMLESDDSLLL